VEDGSKRELSRQSPEPRVDPVEGGSALAFIACDRHTMGDPSKRTNVHSLRPIAVEYRRRLEPDARPI